MTTFFVQGVPQPGGSKRAFAFKRKNGKLGVAVSDANPKVHPWRTDVRAAFQAVFQGAPFDCPLELEVVFTMPRPKGHYLPVSKRRSEPVLRDDAPVWHVSRPDATKLLRALEDALTGLAWTDDCLVVSQRVQKRYADDGQAPGAYVTIEVM